MSTTIQISKENKRKLSKLKHNDNITFDDVITGLLNDYGGTLIEDVSTINSDAVALQLTYLKGNNQGRIKTKDVLFSDLKASSVGDTFVAYTPEVETDFMNQTAEVVYRKGNDVVLLVKTFTVDVKGNRFVDKEIVHFMLF